MSDWTDIIDDVSAHVTLLKELGVRTVELPPGFFAAWDKAGAQPRPPTVPAPMPPPHAPPKAVAPVAVQPLPPMSAQELAPEARREALDKIAERVKVCTGCPLHAAGRTNVVPGQGNAESPDVMFIGEAPGEEEDRQGLAFVGAAGQFLTKMIAAMGYTREQVFIANICKCRPPRNRTPDAAEMQNCLPFLREQISVIRPKAIVLLGSTAIKGILNNQTGVTRMQGVWTVYEGIPVMPTYHPSYVIRFENAGDAVGMRKVKLEVWNALKLVLARLGRPVPQTGKKSE
ncbi:MAG: uracil-DNA glycosylase [Kiritimatiellaeota bacterium]|nr:uracil-DNA glycosylase [Kiritimatiellota bacterium]